ncbi:MAG TPA: hypothetical protein VFI26_08605 [Lysobacter sp.]|nr:hypothetical protein [Lysobacter sp.]
MARLILVALLAIASVADAQAQDSELKVTTDKVIGVTKFLESQPLDPAAPGLRSLMIDWEDKAKEVVDYVCADVLDPIPSESVPHSSELLVQFIFGSAAHQLSNPEDKGALVPSQIAGIRSMLKAYQGFLAADPKARIPRLDELIQKESTGSLEDYLKPIILKSCKGDFEHG